MKLSAVQTVLAPRQAVFDRMADFERFEVRARNRGATVEPLPESRGRGWIIGFEWQGARHLVELVLMSFVRPEGYTAQVATRGIRGTADVSLAEAGTDATRLSIVVILNATGLGGRILLQSVSFMRPMLEARLSRRLAALATEIEGER